MEIKSILLSKTVRGAIITVLVPLSKQLWFDLIITDQAQLIEWIIMIIWFVLTIYGRYKAEKKIVL